jgi:vacuolar-type H+-ATPase subunit I/STV1
MSKIFYVCSYGGSGSKMLCKYLNQFGITFNKIMDIPDIPSKYPIKKETTRALDTEVVKSLEKAYYQLKKKMGDMPFIKKITPS